MGLTLSSVFVIPSHCGINGEYMILYLENLAGLELTQLSRLDSICPGCCCLLGVNYIFLQRMGLLDSSALFGGWL